MNMVGADIKCEQSPAPVFRVLTDACINDVTIPIVQNDGVMLEIRASTTFEIRFRS